MRKLSNEAKQVVELVEAGLPAKAAFAIVFPKTRTYAMKKYPLSVIGGYWVRLNAETKAQTMMKWKEERRGMRPLVNPTHR